MAVTVIAKQGMIWPVFSKVGLDIQLRGKEIISDCMKNNHLAEYTYISQRIISINEKRIPVKKPKRKVL